MFSDDESLVTQLIDDLQELFDGIEEYSDILIKEAYKNIPKVRYPMILVYELQNTPNDRFYDGQEHIMNVGYQFIVYAEQTETKTPNKNVQDIMTIIRDYMRGEKYHALRRIGDTPITPKQDDETVRIGYMRYTGCIDIDTHTIYRRN